MFRPDFGQKVAKMVKNEVFGTLKKKFALVLSGNGLKRKKISFLNFCKKPHVKKKIFGRDMAENGRKMRVFKLWYFLAYHFSDFLQRIREK